MATVIRPCDGPSQLVRDTSSCPNCSESWASCCCPKISEQVCADDCGKILVTNLASCSESQLAANKCTLVVQTTADNPEACLYTPRSIISAAYGTVNTSTICDDLPDSYLEFFNDAVREINSKVDSLWELSEAIVKTCGRCEFYAPPKYNQIITVSDEVINCNSGCQKTRYRFIDPEMWAGSMLVDGWTLKNKDVIQIKDPVTCGCNNAIPSFLKVTYYKKIEQARTLDDCLDIEDDTVNVLKDLMIMNGLGVKFNNELAISRSLDRYKDFIENYNNRTMKKVNNTPYKTVKLNFRIRG